MLDASLISHRCNISFQSSSRGKSKFRIGRRFLTAAFLRQPRRNFSKTRTGSAAIAAYNFRDVGGNLRIFHLEEPSRARSAITLRLIAFRTFCDRSRENAAKIASYVEFSLSDARDRADPRQEEGRTKLSTERGEEKSHQRTLRSPGLLQSSRTPR